MTFPGSSGSRVLNGKAHPFSSGMRRGTPPSGFNPEDPAALSGLTSTDAGLVVGSSAAAPPKESQSTVGAEPSAARGGAPPLPTALQPPKTRPNQVPAVCPEHGVAALWGGTVAAEAPTPPAS